MIFGPRLGCLDHLADAAAPGLDALGLGNASVRAGASLRALAGPVQAQIGQSCVGHALAAACTIAERAKLGTEAPSVSPLAIYAAARVMDGGSKRALLTDRGTSIVAAVRALVALGAPNDTDFPQTLRNLYRLPSISTQARAHGRRGGRYVSIVEEGRARCEAVALAVSSGHAVIFGTDVSRSFYRKTGPSVETRPTKKDELIGRHAMAIVGCKSHPDKPGELVYDVRNTWGRSWRDAGHVWITEDYLTWAGTSGLFVVYGWPALLGTGAAP